MPLTDDPKIVKLANDLLAVFDKLSGGEQRGFRPAHAKGLLVAGTFTPSSEAASLSNAPHFTRASTPVTARFSDAGGIPGISDANPNASPRGLAVRFHLGEHQHTDIISESVPGFATRTAEEFLEFLKAVAATDFAAPPDPAKLKPIERFLGAHPAALRFVQTPKPLTGSFTDLTYFAPNAYHFRNAAGDTRFARYRLVAESPSSKAPPASPKPDFLFDELKTRLKQRPVEYRLLAQLADGGDVVDDATLLWPDSRQLLPLGRLSLTAIKDNNAAEQQQLIFDPIPRVEGISPSADPLLELRAALYLISGRRRRAAGKR